MSTANEIRLMMMTVTKKNPFFHMEGSSDYLQIINFHFVVGNCRDLRFMCTFRFKLWWMTQRMGTSGKDIPFETQFMIVERNDSSSCGETNDGAMPPSEIYTVFLPILEGDFRAVLQGNENDDLEICLESGKLYRILMNCLLISSFFLTFYFQKM